MEQCRRWVRCSEDRSDRRGCGNNKREQMRWKKGDEEENGMQAEHEAIDEVAG